MFFEREADSLGKAPIPVPRRRDKIAVRSEVQKR
jgi:hypothetical protein